MNIRIRSTNFDITPAIDDYVTKKVVSLEKFLNKENEIICDVEIGKTTEHHKSGDIFRAEINIIDGGKQYFAEAEEVDLYTAIDIVRDQAEQVIVNQKKKRDTLFRKGAGKIKNIIKRIIS